MYRWFQIVPYPKSLKGLLSVCLYNKFFKSSDVSFLPYRGRGFILLKLCLVRQRYFHHTFSVEQQRLTSQPWIQLQFTARSIKSSSLSDSSSICSIPFPYIQVAGSAGTYAAAVMMQFNIIIQRQFQQALSRLHLIKGYGCKILLLKSWILRCTSRLLFIKNHPLRWSNEDLQSNGKQKNEFTCLVKKFLPLGRTARQIDCWAATILCALCAKLMYSLR